MTRPISLTRFFASTAVLFLVITLLWTQVSAWTSYPAASLAKILLDSNAETWIESTENKPGQLRATTKFRKVLSETQIVTPIAVVEPAHYTYGTTLLLALLLASRSRELLRRGLIGYLVLLVPQALSLVFVLLYQIIRVIPAPLLGVATWQLDGIAMGQLFCTVVLPTLAPVALWLWMESEFLMYLVASSSLFAHSSNSDQRRTFYADPISSSNPP
jgi:hypothetical protein